MDELLQKLFEAEVLNEETREELLAAYNNKINEAVEQAKVEATADVRAELTEQWIGERDALIEAIDSQIGDLMESEIAELKEDIDRFRDLEAEYAEKVVEAKAAMADELKGDLAELVEQLDAFLEIRLTAELDELMEDIKEVKKNNFGRRIFEAMVEEFRSNFADEDSVEGTLRETEERLADTAKELEEAVAQIATMERKEKMAKVLSPLSGKQREVMEAILKNVDTKNLEEGYKTFIGRVIKESDEVKSEKEEPVLAESASDDVEDELNEGVVVSGNNEEVLAEQKEVREAVAQNKLSESATERLKRLAGIK